MPPIGLVGEDEGHFRVVTALVDSALVANVDWVRDVVDSCRTWRGLHGAERRYTYAPGDARDLRPVTIDGVTIKLQGRIAGEPLKPEASMWSKALPQPEQCRSAYLLLRRTPGTGLPRIFP